MNAINTLMDGLERRRELLSMSKADLAKRAGVPVQTVTRVLLGKPGYQPSMDAVAAIASAMGVEVRLGNSSVVYECSDAPAYRHAQARSKAKRLAKLVQGTMALEAEAVDADVIKQIENDGVKTLLSGAARRLWGT